MTDLRQLRYFVAVARRLHFTRAAEDLRLAQPALSQAISQLEEELDVVLFDRTTRGVSLTPAGAVLLQGAERTLREMEATLAEVRSFAGKVSGRVRLGAWQSMEVRLPDLLAAFREAHPAVDVVISEIVSHAMLDGVRAGSLDVAMLVRSERANMGDLHVEPFLSEPYDLAVGKRHALAQRKQVRLDDLAKEPFILHRPGSAVRDAILAACEAAGFQPRIALETGEMSAARAYVAAGLGVTILPRSSLLSPGPKVQLVRLTPSLVRTSVMVWPTKRPASSAVRTFRKFAQAHKHLLSEA
jgi:DNA-binding transcriptional LysR family regulator